jgi:hypothetical protein
VFYCHSCGASTNLIGLVKHQLNCNYEYACEFIGIETNQPIAYPGERQVIYEQNNEDENENLKKESELQYDLKLQKFNPLNVEYTRLRGWTDKFVDHFNIKECVYGYYSGFAIIPIIEQNTFEARKLYEKEKLLKFFDFKESSNINLSRLRQKFNIWKNDNKELVKQVLNKEIQNWELKHLLLGKTLYPSNSLVGKPCIFNQSNLTKDDLFIREGVSGIAKIWENISTNITATFGSEISKKQCKILNNYNNKILIIDNDIAGLKMLYKLISNVNKIYVISTELEDTDDEYTNYIKNAPIEDGAKFIISKLDILNENRKYPEYKY